MFQVNDGVAHLETSALAHRRGPHVPRVQPRPQPGRGIPGPAGRLGQGVQRDRVGGDRHLRPARAALERERARGLDRVHARSARVRARRRVLDGRAYGRPRSAVSVVRRRRLLEHLPRVLRRPGAAAARPRAQALQGALARRRRLRARRGGGRRRARVRRRRQHGGLLRHRRDEPRVSARRPDDARVRDRRDGGHGPRGRLDVVAARARLRHLDRRRPDLPLPDGASAPTRSTRCSTRAGPRPT